MHACTSPRLRDPNTGRVHACCGRAHAAAFAALQKDERRKNMMHGDASPGKIALLDDESDDESVDSSNGGGMGHMRRNFMG